MANEYLKRTPTSTGNRSVYTWAGWLKRNKINQDYYLFSSGDDTSNIFYVSVRRDVNNNNLTVLFRDGDTSSHTLVFNNNSFRDPGSWMHLVVAVDTTIVDSKSDRVKIYINGKRLTGWTTDQLANLNQNSLTATNAQGELHTIGEYSVSSGSYADMQIFDYFLIDGQALTPDVFGFYKDGDGYQSSGTTNATDFRPGQWMPHAPTKIKKDINRRGGFGVNGFYLPMNDSSNPGADFHCAPNSIIKLKGEDLPQPRNGAPTTSDAYVSQLRSDPYAANLVLAVPGISTATGNNQVVNGNFDSGTTSWTASTGATLTNPEGTLRVTVTQTAGAEQTISGLTVGERYTLSFRLRTDGTNFANQRITINGVASYIGNRTNTIWEQVNYSFTATNSILALYMYKATGGWVEYDDIVLKQEDAPRDYSADIRGSGSNKAVQASLGGGGVGYELGGYYGSSINAVDNNCGHAFSGADGAFVCAGDFTVELWLDPVVATQPQGNPRILGQTNNSGGKWDIYIDQTTSTNRIYTMGGSVALTGGNGSGYGNFVPGQWNHFCLERSGSIMTTYMNGVAVYSQTYTNTIGTTDFLYLGSYGDQVAAPGYGITGKIQDFRFYKGVAKYKGGFDVPKPYTPVGIESWRTITDTCKNNFCTMNPLNHSNGTFANGNLTTSEPGSSGGQIYATMGSNTGKWYYEAHVEDVGTPNTGGTLIGINPLIRPSSNVQNRTAYRSEGSMYNDSGTDSGSSAYAYVAGDTIGVAWDADNKRLWFAKNGTWLGSGDPAGNSNPNVNYTNTETQGPFIAYDNGTGAQVTHLNFGQNPTFSGQITAGTNADGNGKGLFKYAPPTGFLALCEDNLPTPAIADPGEHFKTVLYTGSGSTRAVTGVGFKPDLVWIKSRTNTEGHIIFDSVRGPEKRLLTMTTSTEATSVGGVMSFDDDGYSTAQYTGTNQSGQNYVAWCWKAGGAAVSNTNGTITSQVSVNQTAGFSIVSYSGVAASDSSTNSGNPWTIAHGLGKKPDFMIFKCRTTSHGWYIYHQSLGATQHVLFNNAAAASGTVLFRDTEPTSEFINVGGWDVINRTGQDYISYCWTEIEGFSKFGSYVGNGNADGPFVYCGFKPAWVLVKNSSSTSDWRIYDSSRASTNPNNLVLYSNLTTVDTTTLHPFDFLSNGFKVRGTFGDVNTSADTYIFAAFAESPFQTANAK